MALQDMPHPRHALQCGYTTGRKTIPLPAIDPTERRQLLIFKKKKLSEIFKVAYTNLQWTRFAAQFHNIIEHHPQDLRVFQLFFLA